MKARRFLNLMMASLVAMAYTSCSNSDDVIDTPDPVVKTYTMTVDAQKGSNGTRALSLDGSTLNSTWTVGDEVEVWTADGTTKKYGVLSAESAGASTKLSGTLTELPGNGESLLLKYLSPDYNSQKGTIESISSNCDYSTATVTATVAGSAVTTTTASFANQQAVIKFTLKNADGSASLGNPTAFSVTDGTSTVTLSDIPAETYTANGTGVLYVAFPASGASATITLSATVSGVVYGFAKTDITFTNSKYYGVTVKMTAQASTPTGALSGKFTINSSGTQVYFSKGNLQYIGSASTPYWKFADHQYDYLGTTTSQNGSTETVDRDLFGWGTSGSAPSDQTARAPYYTTATNTNYVSNITTTGTSWGVGSEWDWGHNAISNGGNTADAWRTLTSTEWTYVFTGRPGANKGSTVGSTSYASYTHAAVTIESTTYYGMILFPDGGSFTASEATWGTINGNSAWTTTCTESQWSALEAKGCVFLPAAGYRYGSSVNNVGSYGYYWSSTARDTNYACSVHFRSGYLGPAGSSARYYGFSVRLVREE